MPSADAWQPPEAPDLEALAAAGIAAFERDRPKVIAFDTETTGLAYHDQPFSVQVAWQPEFGDPEAHWFDLGDPVQLLHSPPGVRDFLRSMFAHVDVTVCHNVKFDAHKADIAGLLTDADRARIQWHDTALMSHLLDEHRPKKLKGLAVSLLGVNDTVTLTKRRKVEGEWQEYTVEKPREEHETGLAKLWAKKQYGLASIKEVGYHLLPRGTVVPYGIKDAEWTYALARVLYPQVLRHPEVHELYLREVRLCTEIIFDLEKAGMAVRRDYVGEKVKEYRNRVIQHELSMESIVGKPCRSGHMTPKERPLFFNPASDDEVADYFRDRGFVRDSYDAANLKLIDHPLADALLAYRGDKKLLDGYFTSLWDESPNGVYHPSINPFGTVTGRASSGAERGD